MVGQVVGTMQVPRTRVGINREPGKVMQNNHCTQQQEQVKEGNKIDWIVLEPSKKHGQMHGEPGLGLKKVGIKDNWVSHEVGRDCRTEEHGQQDSHEDRAESMEEVKPGRGLNGHHPGGGIRDQKEVGLRATGTGGGTGMVGGWTMRFLCLVLADTSLVTIHVMSHRPMGALLTPMEGQTVNDFNLQRPGARGCNAIFSSCALCSAYLLRASKRVQE